MGTVKMRYVETVTARWKTYHYYRRGGKRHGRIDGKTGSVEFARNYERIHNAIEKGATTETPEGTFAALVNAYLASVEFRALAPNSRRVYRLYATEAARTLGEFAAEDIARKHVLAYRDTMGDNPGKANLAMSVLRLLYSWGIDRGLLTVNPALGIKKMKMGEHRPWPEAAIETFRADAPAHLVWAMDLALHTGQRKGDLITLQWHAVTPEGVHFAQQKTGANVTVPLYPALQDTLDRIPRRSVMVLTNEYGKVWSYFGFYGSFASAMKECGLAGLTFHGLRKSAATRLAEAGCSTAEIKAITGHASTQMVELYTKGADQRRLAKAAVAKLERKT